MKKIFIAAVVLTLFFAASTESFAQCRLFGRGFCRRSSCSQYSGNGCGGYYYAPTNARYACGSRSASCSASGSYCGSGCYSGSSCGYSAGSVCSSGSCGESAYYYPSCSSGSCSTGTRPMGSCSTGRCGVDVAQFENDAQTFLNAANAVRANQGFAPLAFDSRLQAESQRQADAQARCESCFHAAGGGWEICAGGQRSVGEALNDWLNSPGHRANLLGAFSRAGIACAKSRNGRLYWTMRFN